MNILNSLISLLFYQKLSKGKTKKFKKGFKKRNKSSLTIFKNLGLIIFRVTKFTFRIIIHKKNVCQATVVSSIKSKKIVNFEEYRLKKAK